jgi:hypothetical protein
MKTKTKTKTKRCAAIVLLTLPFTAIPGGGAEPDWLPAAAEDVVVQQLAERMKEIAGEKPADQGPLVEGARTEVRRQRARLETWGRQGIQERAPDLSRLQLPASGDTLVDSIAPYHLCAGFLLLKHMNRLDTDPAARLATAKGLSAIQMAMFSLVHAFMAKGTEAQLEGFLTGKEMEAVWNRIQDQEETREYAARQCQPVVSAIIAE